MYTKKAIGYVLPLQGNIRCQSTIQKEYETVRSNVTSDTQKQDLSVLLHLYRIQMQMEAFRNKILWYLKDTSSQNQQEGLKKSFESDGQLDEFIRSEVERLAKQTADEFFSAAAKTYFNKYFGTIYKAQNYKQEFQIPPLPPADDYIKMMKERVQIRTRIKDQLIAAVSQSAGLDMTEEQLERLIDAESKKIYAFTGDEIHRYEIRGAMAALKQEKIESYQVICADVHSACEKCAALHQKRFPVSEAKEGENLPPIHPNCRCTIGSYIELEEDGGFWQKLGRWLGDFGAYIWNNLQLAEAVPALFSAEELQEYEASLKQYIGQFQPIKINGKVYFFDANSLQNPIIVNGSLLNTANIGEIDRKLLELMKMRDSADFSSQYNAVILQAYQIMMEHPLINGVPQFTVDFFKPYSYYEIGGDTTGEILQLMKEYEEKYREESQRYWMKNIPFFKSIVSNGGELDLKNREPYKNNSGFIFDGEIVDQDALGNITYGYFGKYLGIPDSVLFEGAGYAQRTAGTSKPEFSGTFDDDPRDQYRILQGVMLYEQTHA